MKACVFATAWRPCGHRRTHRHRALRATLTSPRPRRSDRPCRLEGAKSGNAREPIASSTSDLPFDVDLIKTDRTADLLDRRRTRPRDSRPSTCVVIAPLGRSAASAMSVAGTSNGSPCRLSVDRTSYSQCLRSSRRTAASVRCSSSLPRACIRTTILSTNVSGCGRSSAHRATGSSTISLLYQ